MRRRQFVKKIIGFVIGLVSGSTVYKGLPHIDPKDVPPMPKVKPPRLFGTKSMSLVGVDDYIEVSEEDVELQGDFTIIPNVWHHCVYNRVGSVEEMYIDGKEILPLVISTEDCDIMNFRRTQVNLLVEEEFWFRRKV